jgi:hypothetical protein
LYLLCVNTNSFPLAIVHSLPSLIGLPPTTIQELHPPIGLDGKATIYNGNEVDLSQAVVNHIEWVDASMDLVQPPQQKRRRIADIEPGKQSTMTSKQRKAFRASLEQKARDIVESCVVKLPEFEPESDSAQIEGETTRSFTQRRLGELLTSWWDWLDRCKNLCQPENDKEASSYDWSKIDDVFGNLSKLQGVHGYEYEHCLAILQKRFENI